MRIPDPLRKLAGIRPALLVLIRWSLLGFPRRVYGAGAWPLNPPSQSAAALGLNVGSRQDRREVTTTFRVLAVTTVLSIFALVTLGGVVRLTGSGLGCPDWPLCHGRIIPPLETDTLIEYSHRLMASIAGVLILSTAIAVWRSYRNQRWLLLPASIGLVLLGVQVLLGGFTVLGELPSVMVLAHLAVAEALMASMIVVCVVAFVGSSARWTPWSEGGWLKHLPIVTLAALLAAYALLLTGSSVTVSGATVACGQVWPLCQGGLLPEGNEAIIHMVHRLTSVIVGVLVVASLVLVWRGRPACSALRPTCGVLGATFFTQVIMGAVILWTGFPMGIRLLHLSMATLVWMSLAVLAVLVLTGPRSSFRGAAHA